jgi:hypothetical protein
LIRRFMRPRSYPERPRNPNDEAVHATAQRAP